MSGRGRRTERGAAAVEFGLIAPLLIMLVFGMVDFGWLWNRDMIVQNVARDAVRVASLAGSYDDIADTVDRELASYGIDSDQVTVSITCTNVAGPGCANNAGSYDAAVTSGSSVSVRIEYTHNLMTPVGALCEMFGGGCIDSTVVLAKTAEMVRE